MTGIVSYGTYLPAHRVTVGGRGARVAASFDEDSTTMGVAAGAVALARPTPESLYFATTTPAYSDKANAAAIHAALGLPESVFATDFVGSARSGIAALKIAAATGGLAVLADVRVGLPGSTDERLGGDGAAAISFGENPIAELIGAASVTAEFLDRWRDPRSATGSQWEERFGVEQYQPLIERATAGFRPADHVVVVSPNASVVKAAFRTLTGSLSTTTSPIGHSGAADVGIALAAVLDHAGPGETILLVSAADGCDALLFRTTDRIEEGRQPASVTEQLAGGTDVPYLTYLTWRGLLDREPPRRPEPDRASAPASARSMEWKFSFTGSQCEKCAFVHLPPARVCKQCSAIDAMADISMARASGAVATCTVDRLAYSLAPPVVSAVVDFDGGGRYTLEIADQADGLAVGSRVQTTFRRLNTAGGVHNYFWKAHLA